MNKNDQIGVALIGYGSAGRIFHAPLIHFCEGLNLQTVVTSKSHHEIKTRYPQMVVTPNFEDVLQDETIQLVIIATPNQTHFELAQKALLAHKHVVVDKPFTVTSADARALIALAKANHRLLSVFHNRRWDSDFLTLKNVIEANTIDPLTEVEMHFDRFRNYRKPNAWKESAVEGSGILYDLGSHLIDQALQLFGTPSRLFCTLVAQRPDAVIEDNFEVILLYEKLKVTLKASMLVNAPLPKYIVHGYNGSFVKYGTDIQEAALAAGKTNFYHATWGEEPDSNSATLYLQENELQLVHQVPIEKGDYTQFYAGIFAAIQHDTKPPVTAEEALQVIALIELAKKSATSGVVLSVLDNRL